MPDITANTSNSDYVRVTTPKTLLVSNEEDIRLESIIVSSQISKDLKHILNKIIKQIIVL